MSHVSCYKCGTTWTLTKREYKILQNSGLAQNPIVCRSCKIAMLTNQEAVLARGRLRGIRR